MVPLPATTTSASSNAAHGEGGGFGSGFMNPQGELINERNNSEDHIQMLSFSSPNSHTAPPFPYYLHTSNRATGMNYSAGTLSGFKLPFTPSQWMELEHQALIYKYITSNVPIPSYLLNPIRKAFESAGFSTFSSQRSNPLGWGAFQIGFSSSDPEPGRCRRTDGKKWRCSREAVVDQKYCERHMNRGRHRSRKPVEGQSGRAASGATTITKKPATPVASTSPATAMAPGTASTLSLSHPHQHSNLQQQQPDSDTHALSNFNRSVPDNDKSYSNCRQQNPFQEFGLVSSDSLVNPLDQSSSLIHCKKFGDSDIVDDQGNKLENHSLRHFMDVWPKDYSDRTQLSISIPVTVGSDFLHSALSPTSSKLQRSPQELEMGLCIGTTAADHHQRQAASWVPISWEPSIAGPLGEVLHSTPSYSLDMKHNRDNSPHLAASPTGVLQRGALVSLSNSSAGSSPRAKSTKTPDGAGLSNGIVPGMMNPSLPTP